MNLLMTVPPKTKPENIFDFVLATNTKMPVGQTPKKIRETLQNIKLEIAKRVEEERSRLAFQNLKAIQEDRLRELRQAEVIYTMANRGFTLWIDLPGILSWTRKDGLPTFGVLNLDSPRFSIIASVGFDSWVRFQPDLPDDLKPCYKDAVEKLRKLAGSYDSQVSITAQFRGEMPRELEKHVNMCEKTGYFERILVVFEAPKWEINHQVFSFDPIIVGRVFSAEFPLAGPQYFYLGHFDATPIESEVIQSHVLEPHFS